MEHWILIIRPLKIACLNDAAKARFLEYRLRSGAVHWRLSPVFHSGIGFYTDTDKPESILRDMVRSMLVAVSAEICSMYQLDSLDFDFSLSKFETLHFTSPFQREAL